MGASVSIDVMPERITKAMVNELFPSGYDERQFDDRAAKHEDGCISKAQFADLLSRTDVFITHDWGKELDMDNHARVARVNDGLKALGLLTWFDSEKMKGNIKDQMTAGIDKASCVIVCVTRRYCEKVAGNNAEDNCKLEFMYASRRKTGSHMVPVVMEQRMQRTNDWEGPVGMVLGGDLYVDMTGDVFDDAYLATQCAALYQSILEIIGRPLRGPGIRVEQQQQQGQQAERPSFKAGMGSLNSQGSGPAQANGNGGGALLGSQSAPTLAQPATPAAPAAPAAAAEVTGVPLASLDVEQVGRLLTNIKFNAFVAAVMEMECDGETLCAAETVEEVVALGVGVTPKAKVLLNKLDTFRRSGVPHDLLAEPSVKGSPSKEVPAAAPTSPAPAAAPAPAPAATTPRPASEAFDVAPSGPPTRKWVVGDTIRVLKLSDELFTEMQKGHGGHSADMIGARGMTGTVLALHSEGHVRVAVNGAEKWWNPALLQLVKEGSGPAPGTETAPAKPPTRPFKKFDVVRILNVSVADMEEIQKPHGGHSDDMVAARGKEGTVVSLHDAGHVRVKVSGIEKWWAPRMLALVREASEASSLKPGDMVKIRALPVAEAEKLQESHGGINDSMKAMLGKQGTVSGIDADGDVRVFLHNKRFLWNPALIEFVAHGPPHTPALGTGASAQTHLFYCGRQIGKEYLPGSDGQCGPNDGPQCKECCMHQATHSEQLVGSKVRIRAVNAAYAQTVQQNHSGLDEEKKGMLGKEGTLDSVDSDGDFMVTVNGTTRCWNACMVEVLGAGRGATLKLGSGVRIRAVPAAEAETLQKGHGGINDTMKSQLGKEGVVGGFDSDGDVRVVCEDKMYLWNPAILEYARPATVFKAGDVVRIRGVSKEVAEKLQSDHGGINDSMKNLLGKEGVVKDASTASKIRVVVDSTSYVWNPALLLYLRDGPAPA